MGELVAIIAIIMIFGPGFYWVKRRFDLKEKQLTSGDANATKLLQAHNEEHKLLIERLEGLESIIHGNEYQLNLRIAQLMSEHNQALALGPATADTLDPSSHEGGRRPGRAPGRASTADTLDPSSNEGAEPEEISSDDATGPTLIAMKAEKEKGKGKGKRRTGSMGVPGMPSSPTALSTGQVLANRYLIERPLGRGGMGAVYLAMDQVLGEYVAVKVIAPVWQHDHASLVERFRREAAAARRVSSSSVIRIHDIGEAPGGLLYLSMEYFAGKTLAQIMAARGLLDATDLRKIISQVCDGLDAAHRASVIHRDLKPQNVLVGEDDMVKLIDFGLAKTALTSSLTVTGLLLGTPHYMAPEQVRGKNVDARSDIYALGALTYHAATGRPPFEGDDPIGIGFAHLTETPARPRTLNPLVNSHLDEMIMAALAKDPENRPQSAITFRMAL
jgi:eukaryotic-like serine/threonine-protein kinase